MKPRKWAVRAKALLVIEGLKGKPVAEICTEDQISQSLSHQWRDQFLARAATAFEDPQRTRKEARLAQENPRLKQLVGELTLESKKRRTARMAHGRIISRMSPAALGMLLSFT